MERGGNFAGLPICSLLSFPDPVKVTKIKPEKSEKSGSSFQSAKSTVEPPKMAVFGTLKNDPCRELVVVWEAGL